MRWRQVTATGYPPDAPGLGIEVDEVTAQKHPFKQEIMHSLTARAHDNAILDW